MTDTISTILEAEKFFLLYSPPRMTGHYQLERMRELMHRLGEPQNELDIIHIAGTSGKTSTAYFIRALLEQAGKKTGLTVSPHLTSITERAQVQGGVLPEKKFIRYVNEFRDVVRYYDDLNPTYFELVIAFAYWVFAKEKVDYAVIETGLGGLLDATNVVKRRDKLCVITPIGYDHTEVLGNTLERIAAQKAGIVTVGNSLILSRENTLLTKIFEDAVQDETERIHMQENYNVPEFLPKFQAGNWQLARTTYDFLKEKDATLPKLDDMQLDSAAHETPPGRYETHRVEGKTLILDGAHNPQKLEAFFGSLPEDMKHSMTVLFGLRGAPDTKIEACIELLSQLDCPVICTEFQVGQDIKQRHAVSASRLEELCKTHNIEAISEVSYEWAFMQLLKSPGDVKIVTGSLYLVSQVRTLLATVGSDNHPN